MEKHAGTVSKITEDQIKIVENAISHGLPLKMAAYLIDFTPRALYGFLEKAKAWYKDGQDPNDPRSFYWDIFVKWQKADAEGSLRQLERIDSAGDNDWKAAAWMLKTRHPETFNKQPDKNINTVSRSEIILKFPDKKSLPKMRQDVSTPVYELPEGIEEGEILDG
jgi:hypothetical protein